MRFLFISNGSADNLWISSAAELVRRDHAVLAMGPWNRTPLAHSQMKSEGSWREKLHASKVSYEPLSAALPLPRRLARFNCHTAVWKARIARQISAFKPDLCLINSADFKDSLPILKSVAASGCSYTTLDHGIFTKSWPTDELIDQLAPIYRDAKANFFVSRDSLRLAQHQLATTLEHARIVQNPYHVPYSQGFYWPQDTSTIKLASVARLHPTTKGQDIILDLLAMKKWQERPIHVNFYGRGGNEESLRRDAERLHIQNITFHGFTSDIESIWAENHALLMPSREENMPVAMIEAALCGRPVIASAVGGVPEFIIDQETGFLAPAASLPLLDATMEIAWQQRERWQSIGLANQNHAQQFISQNPGGDFADILESLGLPSR